MLSILTSVTVLRCSKQLLRDSLITDLSQFILSANDAWKSGVSSEQEGSTEYVYQSGVISYYENLSCLSFSFSFTDFSTLGKISIAVLVSFAFLKFHITSYNLSS